MAKQILSTTDTLDTLWNIVNERRTTSRVVKVPVEELISLLRDHATLSETVRVK